MLGFLFSLVNPYSAELPPNYVGTCTPFLAQHQSDSFAHGFIVGSTTQDMYYRLEIDGIYPSEVVAQLMALASAHHYLVYELHAIEEKGWVRVRMKPRPWLKDWAMQLDRLLRRLLGKEDFSLFAETQGSPWGQVKSIASTADQPFIM